MLQGFSVIQEPSAACEVLRGEGACFLVQTLVAAPESLQCLRSYSELISSERYLVHMHHDHPENRAHRAVNADSQGGSFRNALLLKTRLLMYTQPQRSRSTFGYCLLKTLTPKHRGKAI